VLAGQIGAFSSTRAFTE
jgi:hypothetical protein